MNIFTLLINEYSTEKNTKLETMLKKKNLWFFRNPNFYQISYIVNQLNRYSYILRLKDIYFCRNFIVIGLRETVFNDNWVIFRYDRAAITSPLKNWIPLKSFQDFQDTLIIIKCHFISWYLLEARCRFPEWR